MVCPRCGENKPLLLTATGFCKACNKAMYDATKTGTQIIPSQILPSPIQAHLAPQILQVPPDWQTNYIHKKIAAGEVINKLNSAMNVCLVATGGFFFVVAAFVTFGSKFIGESLMLPCIIYTLFQFMKAKQAKNVLIAKYGVGNQQVPINQ